MKRGTRIVSIKNIPYLRTLGYNMVEQDLSTRDFLMMCN